VMTWLVVLLVGATLLVLVLSVPVAVIVRAAYAGGLQGEVRVEWLFGLIGIDPLRAARRRRGARRAAETSSAAAERSSAAATAEPRQSTGAGPEPSAPAADTGRRRRRGLRVLRAVAGVRGLSGRVGRFGRDLVRQVRVDRVHLRAAFGLDDPAETGWLYAMAAPVCVGAATAGWDVACRPLFTGAGVQGTCSVRVRVVPLAVARVCLWFLVSPAVLRAGWVAWRASR